MDWKKRAVLSAMTAWWVFTAAYLLVQVAVGDASPWFLVMVLAAIFLAATSSER